MFQIGAQEEQLEQNRKNNKNGKPGRQVSNQMC